MQSALLATITWDQSPILVELGKLQIRWYGLFFATAILTGIFFMKKIFVKENKNTNHLDPLLWYIVGGIIIGARLGHCLFYEPGYYLSEPLKILKVWEGGLASHGGIIGIFIALWLFCRKYKEYRYMWLLDRLTLPSAFGAAFIRLGNFFNSEIVGLPTDKPWGIIFKNHPKYGSMPVHPAQLYEAITYLTLGIILVIYYRKTDGKHKDGMIPGIFLTIAFIARFLIEFVKNPQSEFGEMTISVGQWLSIPIIILGLVFLFLPKKGQSLS